MQVSSVELEPISHALNWESDLVELNGLDCTDNTVVMKLLVLQELENKCAFLHCVINRRLNRKKNWLSSIISLNHNQTLCEHLVSASDRLKNKRTEYKEV